MSKNRSTSSTRQGLMTTRPVLISLAEPSGSVTSLILPSPKKPTSPPTPVGRSAASTQRRSLAPQRRARRVLPSRFRRQPARVVAHTHMFAQNALPVPCTACALIRGGVASPALCGNEALFFAREPGSGLPCGQPPDEITSRRRHRSPTTARPLGRLLAVLGGGRSSPAVVRRGCGAAARGSPALPKKRVATD